MYKNLLAKLNSGEYLSQDESQAFIDLVFEGVIPTEILTESLILLNKNGFGSEELTGFARSMRNASQKVICNKDIVDNCGTGGDGLGTFNISTTASLIAACTGVNVAKHGNKAITSNSGSADLLESAGSKPLAITNCLNFGNPEEEKIMYQFVETIKGMKKICKELNFPVVSGNVSFYNGTSGSNIAPTTVIGGIGLIEDYKNA